MLTQEKVKEALKYLPDSGRFIRKSSPNKAVGTVTNGYLIITLHGERCMAHRLAWIYVYGEMPKADIDHIDGDRLNNQIDNLRSVTRQENSRNAETRKNNVSGVMGVCWHKVRSKWRAYITVDNKQIHLGVFVNKEEAISARKAAEKVHGFHQNHGRTALPWATKVK